MVNDDINFLLEKRKAIIEELDILVLKYEIKANANEDDIEQMNTIITLRSKLVELQKQIISWMLEHMFMPGGSQNAQA